MAGVSGRYARALFRVAEESGKGDVERFGSLLEGFLMAYGENERLRSLFLGPHVTAKEKKSFLESVFADEADARVLRFFKTLVDKGRISILGNILLDYRKMELDARNVREALIETAFPLDEKTLDEIRAAFRAKTGASEIKATVRVVPELVGGVRVTIDSAVYDGTVRAELDRMRESMKSRG